MGSCLRGARCAPTKTQSRVEISPVGAILTRQPPEPVRPAWRRHCWRGHSRASTGSSGSTHCDAARASRRRNTAAGRRTEQACSARQRRVGGPERACGARQRRVGRPERKVCTRQRWVDNPSAPAARGGSATERACGARQRRVGGAARARCRQAAGRPGKGTAYARHASRRRVPRVGGGGAGAEAGESEAAAIRRGPVGGPNALGVPPRRAVGGREAHEGWVRRRRIQSKKARFGLEARQLTPTHALIKLKSRTCRAWDHTLKSGPPEIFFL